MWPPLLDRYHPDFVVMLFGPNDAGDHRSRDHLYLYATASWRRHMTRQLDDAIATLEQGGAHVGIVLNPKFILTTGVGPLNDVYASAATRSKRPTFDLGLIVNQNTREYRYDGFHYTQAGADATGGELVGWIGRIRHGTG